MISLVVDTSILIGILNETTPRQYLDEVDRLYVSSITVMELFALSGTSLSEDIKIEMLLNPTDVEDVTGKIARRAGKLARTRTKKVSRADLIIAATALELNLPLITKNTKDFRGIPGLKVQSTL